MTSTLISLCLPTYNGADYLDQTLDSIRHITWPGSYEVIIVDDCSTDNTLKIAEQFKSSYDNVRIIKNRKNVGLVNNWNNCLKEANGEWIQFLFQDDLIHENTIQLMYEKAIEYDVPLVLCDRDYMIEDNALNNSYDFIHTTLLTLQHFFPQGRHVLPADSFDLLVNNFLKTNYLGEPIVGLFSSGLLTKYGLFDPSLKQICDYEFWLRISLNEPFYYLNKKLVQFRIHGQSQSARNSGTIGVDPTTEDKIKLGNKILTSDYFSSISNFKDNAFGLVKEEFKKVLIWFIHKHGLSQIHRLTRPLPLTEVIFKEIKSKHPGLLYVSLRNRIKRAFNF